MVGSAGTTTAPQPVSWRAGATCRRSCSSRVIPLSWWQPPHTSCCLWFRRNYTSSWCPSCAGGSATRGRPRARSGLACYRNEDWFRGNQFGRGGRCRPWLPQHGTPKVTNPAYRWGWGGSCGTTGSLSGGRCDAAARLVTEPDVVGSGGTSRQPEEADDSVAECASSASHSGVYGLWFPRNRAAISVITLERGDTSTLASRGDVVSVTGGYPQEDGCWFP